MIRTIFVGIDEAGVGPLVGGVWAAAVGWDGDVSIPGVRDSKTLSPARRASLDAAIRAAVPAYGIGSATHEEIDEINILRATHLAMGRALADLRRRAATHGQAFQISSVLVDGNRIPPLDFDGSVEAIVKGDAKVPAIGAASILAKQARDAEMDALHAQHPDYGFDSHRGYPAPVHLERLRTLGPLPQHRRSFAPVRALLNSADPSMEPTSSRPTRPLRRP